MTIGAAETRMIQRVLDRVLGRAQAARAQRPARRRVLSIPVQVMSTGGKQALALLVRAEPGPQGGGRAKLSSTVPLPPSEFAFSEGQEQRLRVGKKVRVHVPIKTHDGRRSVILFLERVR